MKTKEEIKLEIDDIFEDMNSYTGEKVKEDELFDRVISHISLLRKNDIESMIKEVQNWLTQWRRDFANRPLEDRKDAFAECYIIEIALSSHLSEELKKI